MKARKRTAPPAPTPGQTMGSAGAAGDTDMADAGAVPAGAAGAAAAAGVLTAIDEDEEGAQEAPVPEEFEVSEDEGEGDE